MEHYRQLIQWFDMPNGLCSSITELKHMEAVKRPYWHTNKYQALGQMLFINQHLDKLAASHIDFKHHHMLQGTCLSIVVEALGRILIQMHHLHLHFYDSSLTQQGLGCDLPWPVNMPVTMKIQLCQLMVTMRMLRDQK